MRKRRFHWEKAAAARPTDLVIRSCLPQWIVRVLRNNGIKRMSVISTLSDKQLLEIPGIGPRSLALIRDELGRVNELRKQASTQHPTPRP